MQVRRYPSILIGLFLLAGCDKPHETRQTVADLKKTIPGNYVGRYDGGVEYFFLGIGGNFKQIFVKEGVTNYQSDGSWTLKRSQDHYLITFYPFIEAANIHGTNSKPRTFDEGDAHYYSDEGVIIFDRELNYVARKQR